MSDIFLSYASEDRERIRPLVRTLEHHGWSVWWDRAISPGKTFDQVLEEALDAARCVVVVWSNASVTSRWVRTEAEEGGQRGLLVPVLLDAEVRIPLAFRQIQAARLVDWEEHRPHAEFDRLLQALTALLGAPASVGPAAPVVEPPGPPSPAAALPADAAPPVVFPKPASAPEPSERAHAPQSAVLPNAGTPRFTRNRLLWLIGLVVVVLLPGLYVLRPHAPPETLQNSIEMAFTLIKAGEFKMGSANGSTDERPVHTVRISRAFYVGTYEVTQGQWEAIMGSNPSQFTGDANRPVEQVSWEDAQEFIRKLNAKEGGTRYRLPTEAEWEYAARAGSTTAYSFGEDAQQLGEYAWYDANAKKTHPVGQRKPNAWGLYDMHGNVWEWVQDWYGAAAYAADAADDPHGPATGSERVIRGGSWFYEARNCRAASRDSYAPGKRSGSVGLRLLRTAP